MTRNWFETPAREAASANKRLFPLPGSPTITAAATSPRVGAQPISASAVSSSTRPTKVLMCRSVRRNGRDKALGPAGRPASSSVVEDRQVELAEPLPIGEEVELDDLAVSYRGDADRERLPIEEADRPGNAVDQRRPYVQIDPGVAERLACDHCGAAELPPSADPVPGAGQGLGGRTAGHR